MRTVGAGCVLLALSATSAVAQVRTDVRLEKGLYLVGEPVVVLVDLRNVGDEAVGYQGACSWNQRFEIAGGTRRTPPNISGCFLSTVNAAGCGSVDHPPILEPGRVTTFRYLLKEYDLAAGDYRLSVSGNLRVQWKYYATFPQPNLPPPPSPLHKEGDSVEGTEFAATLSLRVVKATERELRAAFAPLVSDADGKNCERKVARAAIAESAPPFLETVIGRFASEANEYDTSAFDALGRIASAGSRERLKTLFRASSEASRRMAIVLALARAGRRSDAEFFAGVLRDSAMDVGTRRYAALGLGRIGGDLAVRLLDHALVDSPREIRPSLATALGNTRSFDAGPVLIRMFGNDPAQNEVCGGLKTLTHQDWCDGTAADPAARRRQWLRTWKANRSKRPLFGPDSCPSDPVAPAPAPPPAVPAVRPPTGPPRISAVAPSNAAPRSALQISGYALDGENSWVIFKQGDRERTVRIRAGASGVDPDNDIQYANLFVPPDLAPGKCELVIDANGRRSAPADIVITNAIDPALAGIFPRTVHPAQFVLLTTATPPHLDDEVHLTDARGREWRRSPGVLSIGVAFSLPDDAADGPARVRLVRKMTAEERLSPPLDFLITSAPYRSTRRRSNG